MTHSRVLLWSIRISLLVVTAGFAAEAGVGLARGNFFQFVAMLPLAMIVMVAAVFSWVDRDAR